MTKSEKIRLWVFVGMFVIPELLWSPTINYILAIFENENDTVMVRDNFLVSGDNGNLLALVWLIELFGLLGLMLTVKKSKLSTNAKVSLISVLSILSIINVLILYLFIGIGNVTL